MLTKFEKTDHVLKLTLVIPVYNEGEAINLFVDEIKRVFDNELNIVVELLFINDGSTDMTLELLLERQRLDSRIVILDLSRNFGKEQALSAGLQAAKGEVIVPIDVDLQDPPELIIAMIAKWQEGFDVVLARRTDRQSDTWMKRATAGLFYRIHNKISTPTIPENVGDFRLMTKQVVDVVNQLNESQRFMKGLFAWAGFRTAHVDYTREQRIAGETKFNGWKLWNLALEGFTSFSTSPLRIWTYVGFIISIASFIYAILIILDTMVNGVDAPGYASLIVVVTSLGGLQLIGIGVVGEYLGRTYIESKQRPGFIVRRSYYAEKH
jgi:glycosyltransferase involved in cell wall biosynthesis